MQHTRHGGARTFQVAGDLGAGHPGATQQHDHVFPHPWRAPAQSVWPRAAIVQLTQAACGETLQPLARGAPANPQRFGSGPDSPALLAYSPHQQVSTRRTGSWSTVGVHPGFLSDRVGMALDTTQRPSEGPRLNSYLVRTTW